MKEKKEMDIGHLRCARALFLHRKSDFFKQVFHIVKNVYWIFQIYFWDHVCFILGIQTEKLISHRGELARAPQTWKGLTNIHLQFCDKQIPGIEKASS